ncbi:hypothetical protein SAMN05428942_7306 [Streptomyces sp. 2112.2]|uniref:hypothetical protein n=1 Tax=Streptomyces sp. 2112.2 TaxID=1881024 RepID=UPI000894B010|nr:hypothetical protein [Streptomyces sp. 2112.2]SEF16591.1 hypothetical protein SAMN05428942_7306 [Streptomyces sp. 2112.2]
MARELWGIPLSELATDRQQAALRADEAARDGERVAADPKESPLIRAQAKVGARYAREHARDYRYEAELFAAGEIPECYWTDGPA